MVTLHPAEKEWKIFVFDGSAKQQIKAFVKCEKLISIGSMAPIANKFYEAIKTHCDECCNEKVRQWFEYSSKEEGVLHCYLQAVLQAKLALAVAVAAKAVYIKIPKVGDDSKKKEIVAASKRHIECAKVGRALCAYVLLLAHV